MSENRETTARSMDELEALVESARTPADFQDTRDALDRRDQELRREGVNWAKVAQVNRLRRRLEERREELV